MITTADFKKGQRIEIDGQPFVVIESSYHSPTARGANTLVRTRLRNILTGQLVDKTFKAGEKFKRPDFHYRSCTYLYSDGKDHHFMDSESYEQFSLSTENLGDDSGFLADNLSVRAMVFNDKIVGIELPHTIDIPIAECEPAIKGDTVSAVTKPARLASGATVQVPVFVEEGDVITVDSREKRYVRRA